MRERAWKSASLPLDGGPLALGERDPLRLEERLALGEARLGGGRGVARGERPAPRLRDLRERGRVRSSAASESSSSRCRSRRRR